MITVFTVQGGMAGHTPPRRVHFRRLHLIRAEDTGPTPITHMEVGFYLAAPECRLDDVEVSGFRGAGVRLVKAHLTSLHRCRLWHNRVNVEDLGASQATEMVGCRLIYASDTGLVWNSRGLTVQGGAIEQSARQEVRVGQECEAMAQFYGVHFEHKPQHPVTEPMIICGKPGTAGSVQVAFDRCAFFGNNTMRQAIRFQGVDSCEVVGCRFESFYTEDPETDQVVPIKEAPIEVESVANNTDKGHHLVLRPSRAGAEAADRWPDAKEIIIETGEYIGDFTLPGDTFLHGGGPDNPVRVFLLPGRHTVGFRWGYFFFDVKEDGTVENVSNLVAASAKKNRLVFNTQIIDIDPRTFGELGGQCEFMSYPRERKFPLISRERRSFVVSRKVYGEATAYFNPEYGFPDRRELIVGGARFYWTVKTDC